MNKLAVVVFTALSLGSVSALAATSAPVTVNGGTVHFKGDVVSAACAVDAGSADGGKTVSMGQVRTAKLDKVGSTSSPVGFNIQLNDCDTAISTKASVAFSGVTIDSTNPTVLSLQGAASGGATNVGIQILDNAGSPLPLDGATFSKPSTLNNGTNLLSFQARYFATGAATAGTANADATFKVQYQ